MNIKDFFSDARALGSWILYVLVFARASIEWYRPFVDQMIIAAILLILLSVLFSYDGYIARGILVATFTSVFYQDLFFTLFISFVVILIGVGSYYQTTKKELGKGVLVGLLLSACISYITLFLL